MIKAAVKVTGEPTRQFKGQAGVVMIMDGDQVNGILSGKIDESMAFVLIKEFEDHGIDVIEGYKLWKAEQNNVQH